MRGLAEYAASCVLLVAIAGGLCAIFLRAPAMNAVLISAALAVGVQVVAFLVARSFRARNLLLGWGLGSGLRVLALVAYAIVIAQSARAPIAPALLSFAAFLFLTTVVEPVFLKR